MITKKKQRQANLLAGKLTPTWLRGHKGPVMAQFLRQMRRRRTR